MNITKYNDYTQVIKMPFTEIGKIDFALCAQPRQTLNAYYNNCTEKPDILINGGFFNMSNGQTCFNYKDEGQNINETTQYQWGMGLIGDKEIQFGAMNTRNDWRDFISGYPVLIDEYQAIDITFATELNYKARRSIMAYDDSNFYLIAIDSPGMAFKAMQSMLLELGVRFAINLDGGGSTRVLQNGKCITNGTENRPVDNVVAVYLKKESSKLYRVQLGAFRSVDNAKNYLQQIKALGGVYGNSYVREVDGLYKIQTGCFAVKANAEKMRDDLKSKGYNCFIVEG